MLMIQGCEASPDLSGQCRVRKEILFDEALICVSVKSSLFIYSWMPGGRPRRRHLRRGPAQRLRRMAMPDLTTTSTESGPMVSTTSWGAKHWSCESSVLSSSALYRFFLGKRSCLGILGCRREVLIGNPQVC